MSRSSHHLLTIYATSITTNRDFWLTLEARSDFYV